MALNKVKVLLICLAGTALGIPGAANAGADSGLYIGVGAGNATLKDSAFEESDSAYKLFGGYNIGFIPFVDLALEASYVDFGKPSTSTESIEVSGLNAFGLAGLNFGPFGVFAKAGIVSWSTDTRIGTTSTEDSGTDPAYGLGARLAIGSFSVRAEYEFFDLGDADLGMASVSGVFTF
ncbi:MAG: porin family protein [Gammaproteobacteria bacterium]|nr:porin family protein [Gammaproteobacteria bacterium]MBT8135302.1 porin family protein [Gammaproteobacteria bacterium]NNJ48894.1 outer membrane beta-barrel protein [Gammaproteobacteria bacterium]